MRLSTVLTLSAAALAFAACSPKPAEPNAPTVDATDAGPVPADPGAAATPTDEASETPAPEGERSRGRGDRMSGPMTLADMQARFDRRFDRMDANGDGVLTADEMQPVQDGERGGGRGGGRMLERADANNDGRITRTEMRAGAGAMFRMQDTNGDGTVTEDERPQRGERGPR